MKKTIRICAAVMLILGLVVPTAVFGASSSVSITGGAAEVGKTVTVTVTYKGGSLGYVNGQMTYDNSKLQYISGGSSQGDAGLVELKSYASDTSGKLSFKVKFKAIGSGNVKLKLETLETQNLDGDQSLGTPSAGGTVKVTGAKATTAAPKETATQATTAEKETTQAETTAAEESSLSDEGQPAQNAGSDSQSQGGVNYPLIIGLAAVVIILIVIIALRLRGRRRK